ncbi:hypothetical protein F66182_3896 [Fusarium sp. NRRL 66182]|nr:hypothetical protein F66182_3896 [Fusarium sp. NRRL 66182]
MPDPPPPLPLAANRAALSNHISLLLASRSSVLKTMNLSRPAPTARRTLPDGDDDDDLTRGPRPNEGVGYVPDKKEVQKFRSAKEERMLRGRMAKGNAGRIKAKLEESESEEEAGRSALGKRKRPRREVEVGPESGKQSVPATTVETEDKGGSGEVEVGADIQESVTKDEDVDLGNGTTDNKRRRRNRKKKTQKNVGTEGQA